MMQVDVFDIEHKKVGKAELPEAIFGAEVKEALLWEQVKAQRASRRSGTHATKTRANVSGGGAKPYKQKGTGRARQGSIRAPNHVGGGVVFGPQPRDYSYRLPKTARRSALRSALSLRVKEGALTMLKAFALEKPRTKSVLDYFGKLGHSNVLLVDVGNEGLLLSARNLPKAKGLEASALNVYDILNHAHLVLTEAALREVINKAQATPKGASGATQAA